MSFGIRGLLLGEGIGAGAFIYTLESMFRRSRRNVSANVAHSAWRLENLCARNIEGQSSFPDEVRIYADCHFEEASVACKCDRLCITRSLSTKISEPRAAHRTNRNERSARCA